MNVVLFGIIKSQNINSAHAGQVLEFVPPVILLSRAIVSKTVWNVFLSLTPVRKTKPGLALVLFSSF